MLENQLIAVLALQHVPNIGDITAKKLINHCGCPEAIFKEKRQNLLKIDGIGGIVISDLFNTKHFQAAENELRFIKENNISCLYFADADYPERLKHCIDSPILLFQAGNINLKNQHH